MLLEKLFIDTKRSLRVLLNSVHSLQVLNNFQTKASIWTLLRLGKRDLMDSIKSSMTKSLFEGY